MTTVILWKSSDVTYGFVFELFNIVNVQINLLCSAQQKYYWMYSPDYYISIPTIIQSQKSHIWIEQQLVF